jgi:hypothetical protein
VCSIRPVPVEAHDRFTIHYNPDHPEDNNSLGSNNSRASIYSRILTIGLGVVMILLFLKEYVFRRW